MNKKTEERSEETEKERKDGEAHPKRKPRGALFDSGDPTLARQLAENPYGSKR